MSKEHAYAYEAGYRDGSVHYELEHCPACKNVADLQEALDENARLRNECNKMERLVVLLRNDCDIDASWDGLRNFWTIGLTEDGCLMRDRACKAEAENAKLRLLVRDLHRAYIGAINECEGRDAGLIWEYSYDVDTELAKSHAKFESDRHRFDVDMQELGMKVTEY